MSEESEVVGVFSVQGHFYSDEQLKKLAQANYYQGRADREKELLGGEEDGWMIQNITSGNWKFYFAHKTAAKLREMKEATPDWNGAVKIIKMEKV